ncbi:unnamed protein product [Toxocara canis]|uniref:Integron gene cassette protein n=1 Tax=Toxocara canis TaxID=6265 RepID=A0A183UG72_TOXCA|nr:unnamed protein product [Toxocara canis]
MQASKQAGREASSRQGMCDHTRLAYGQEFVHVHPWRSGDVSMRGGPLGGLRAKRAQRRSTGGRGWCLLPSHCTALAIVAAFWSTQCARPDRRIPFASAKSTD